MLFQQDILDDKANFLNSNKNEVAIKSLSKVYAIFPGNFRFSLPSMASRHRRFMVAQTPRKFVHKFHADSKRRHVSLFLSSRLSVTHHNYKGWLMLSLVSRLLSLKKHPHVFYDMLTLLKLQKKQFFIYILFGLLNDLAELICILYIVYITSNNLIL